MCTSGDFYFPFNIGISSDGILFYFIIRMINCGSSWMMLYLIREGFKPMIELADSLQPIAIEVVETFRCLYDEFAEPMNDMYDEAGRP